VQEVVIIFAASNGYVDDVPVARVKDFERDLYRFMETQYKPVADKIAKDKKFDEETEKQVRAMIEEFKKTVSYDEKKSVEGGSAGAGKAGAGRTKAEPETKKPEARSAAAKA
jgi:hypothetical protein